MATDNRLVKAWDGGQGQLDGSVGWETTTQVNIPMDESKVEQEEM